MYGSDLSFNFFSPTKIVFGNGTLEELPMELEALNASRTLLVTDQTLKEHTSIVDRAEKVLRQRHVGTYCDVTPDAEVSCIERGVSMARELEADSIVSVGGGSVMDAGKGIALLLAHGGQLMDHQGFQNLPGKIAPHIAVPTTAGTGSEVSYVFVTKEAKKKVLFCDFHLIPPCTILDPEVTVDLPAGLTAATAIDALTHAIEAMHSNQRQPFADAMAKEAIHLIRTYLPQALADGQDLTARGQLLGAATMAGIAFSNAQVGLVHAMAHSVGARHGVHHGTANAICLPHVIRFNTEACADVYAAAARAFGLAPSGQGDVADTMAFADAIAEFVADCGLPTRLSEVGLSEDDLAGCAAASLNDGSIVYNPRFAMDVNLLLPVFQQAY